MNMFEQLLNHPDVVPILAVVMGIGAGIIWIIFATIYYTARIKAREQTKREIAAYVAEGTIDAQTAIALLNAGAMESDEVRDAAASSSWCCGGAKANVAA